MVMAVLLTNNARSTLLNGINALQTEIRLRAGGGNTFPTITATGQWFPITIEDSVGAIEIMRVIARSGDVFTVRRAQEGTDAKSFSANDVVELRLTVGAMQELVNDTHTNFGRIYMTPADGVDSKIGVPAGYYFNVRSPLDDSYVDEYQNVNGVAVATGKGYPSGALTQAMSEQIDKIGSLDYLSEQLAQIAVDKGWDASFVVDGDENQHQINNSLIRTVKTPDELLLIQNPKNKQIAHVESIQKTFIYDADSVVPENGVTVIGKWEMQIQEAYYASWFALPDMGDMSEQIKIGYKYATSKKRTFIIDANFNVRSNQTIVGSPLFTAVNVLSNSHLYFLPQGKLSLITANETNSNIICAKDVDNYIITRPKLVGDRLTNTATEGTREWGYGLTIYTSSNGYIFEPDIKNCMGDGLYIGKNWGNNTDDIPTNITVVRPKIDRVRRNGISLTSGKDVFVDSPIVSNVTTIDGIAPTEPASGLDIEPESAPDSPIARLENCIIHNPTFINCDKAINFWNQPVGSFMDVRITGETNIYNDSTPHTGLWLRNERACTVGSRLHIDKIVFNSKLDQPVLAFIYETSNVDVVIGEMVNNCNQNLDFVYAPVNGAQVFGRFKIGKLSTTNQNFGFTVVYSSLNTGCTTGLRIESVDCKLGAFNLNSTTKMNKTSRYFVNAVTVINSSKNTNEILASILQFESYGVSTPTINMAGDSSKVKIALSPTSPLNNPLIIQGLQVPYERSSYTKLKLKHGAYTVLQRETGETKVAELVGQFEFLV